MTWVMVVAGILVLLAGRLGYRAGWKSAWTQLEAVMVRDPERRHDFMRSLAELDEADANLAARKIELQLLQDAQDRQN